MLSKTVQIGGRTIQIIGGRNTIYNLSDKVCYPVSVTKMVQSGSGLTVMSLFGNMWSWEMFPEKKTQYDKELAEYAVKLPDKVTLYTKNLPDNSWASKYIPAEAEVDEIKKGIRQVVTMKEAV